MIPFFLSALLILITTAKFCQGAPISRLILQAFVVGPAQWLERPEFAKAIPYAVATIALALLVVSAPELSFLAAGLDVQLFVDLSVAISAAVAQIGIRRLRVLAHKAMLAVAAPQKNRSRRIRVRRVRPSSSNNDEGDPVGFAYRV